MEISLLGSSLTGLDLFFLSKVYVMQHTEKNTSWA